MIHDAYLTVCVCQFMMESWKNSAHSSLITDIGEKATGRFLVDGDCDGFTGAQRRSLITDSHTPYVKQTVVSFLKWPTLTQDFLICSKHAETCSFKWYPDSVTSEPQTVCWKVLLLSLFFPYCGLILRMEIAQPRHSERPQLAFVQNNTLIMP